MLLYNMLSNYHLGPDSSLYLFTTYDILRITTILLRLTHICSQTLKFTVVINILTCALRLKPFSQETLSASLNF